MTLNREEEEKVNVIQYQPYEDHEYSDISSIVRHPVTGGRLFLGNIFSATDNLILDFYKISLVISIVHDDKIDSALLEEMGIQNVIF